MRTSVLLFILAVCTGLAVSQTRLWESSAALGTYPSFMGTGSTERGIAATTITLQPYTRIWELSAAQATYPPYLGTANTERGCGYGTIGANERVLIVTRSPADKIFVLDAATGDSVGTLDTTGLAAIASGTFRVNDVEVSDDGVVFVCNLTANASSSAFKVYKWSSESATPVLAVTYTGTAFRYGDKFTVTGSTADNSVTIWAAAASGNTVVKFTTADNGATFTPTEIALTGLANGSSPAVYPNTAGTEMFVNSNGRNVKRYQVDGTLLDSLSSSIVGTGSNALRYFEANARRYLVVYAYGTGNENVRTVDITAGLSGGVLVGASPSLGTVSNGNGIGDVALKDNGDNTVSVYVFATNNGVGAYRLDPANSGFRERLYLVSRKAGDQVYVLDAETGDSLGSLDTTGLAAIASGIFRVNDVDVSADGIIYVCNLVVNASTDAFKVYKWESETATPELALQYSGTTFRFGDKIAVTGSTGDNSIAIWAAGASSNTIVKFTTADNGATFTPAEIALTGTATGPTPSVCPTTGGTEFFVNSNGQYLKRYLSDGTLVDSLSSSIVSTGANALRYFELAANKYVAVYAYGAGNENLRIVDITAGLGGAFFLGATPSLGSAANGNGVGDVSVKANGDGTETVYVLGTNNGIGAYLFIPPGGTSVEPAEGTVPQAYSLDQNYPNPFNPSTTISFTIPERVRVTLKVYDILGREVANLVDEDRSAGRYLVRWDARTLAAGPYFYRLQAGTYAEIKKLLLLK